MTEPQYAPCDVCGAPVELVTAGSRREPDITQTGETKVPALRYQCTVNWKHRQAPRI